MVRSISRGCTCFRAFYRGGMLLRMMWAYLLVLGWISHNPAPARAVSLIDDLFQVAAVQLPGAFFNCPIDIVLGHTDGLSVVDGVPQS